MKRGEEDAAFNYTDEILTRSCPLKLLVEITTGSYVIFCVYFFISSIAKMPLFFLFSSLFFATVD